MREIIKMLEEFNSVLYEEEKTRSFPIDLVEIENGYRLDAELPGVEKESIDISFEDGYLTITAKKNQEEGKYLFSERYYGNLKRVIYFGNIKEDKISAKLDNGILSVTITLKKEEITKKNIVIE